MKTFLANAVALSIILYWSRNFTSSRPIALLMDIPVYHGCSSEKKHTKGQNPIPSLLAVVTASFELEYFKVKASVTMGHLAKSIKVAPRGTGWDRR